MKLNISNNSDLAKYFENIFNVKLRWYQKVMLSLLFIKNKERNNDN